MVAKDAPTRVFVDYARAGQYGPVPPDAMGKPAYPPDSGVERWEQNLVPIYDWYDGTREVYVFGDEIDPSKPVVLNQPLGERRNPDALIHAFKIQRAIQPYDTERNVLVVPKLWQGFWEHSDWQRAIAEGMAAMGAEYSGELGFVETVQYSALHHEVVLASAALGCGDCHAAEAVDCRRCHTGAVDADVSSYTRMIHPGTEGRMNFRALGYRDDPALIGGRFVHRIGQGMPTN
jgi:hypothetical protein